MALVVVLLALGRAANAAPGDSNPYPGYIDGNAGDATIVVWPAGDPTMDISAVQWALDNVAEGGTVLLKEGAFDFGDWKTNPIPGGFVAINQGVTLKGDGFDANGDPKTIIQGGGYRNKNHWEHCEWGVVTFGGDASGGVLEGVWLREPHFYAVFASGFCGQNHENMTIRKVKVTDISNDIPDWYQYIAIGRSIDMGANIPEWGVGGPSGTVTIEGCDISNRGSAVDLDYIDPDTGTPYYRDPDGNDLLARDSQGIGLWMSTAVNYVIRNNTLQVQNEGIVTEGMGGTGDIIITRNDISVEPVALDRHLLHGYRLDGWHPDWGEIPFARVVRVEKNKIQVVGEPEEEIFTAGMVMGTDSGLPGYDGTVVVEGNDIEMHNGDAALVFGAVVTDPAHHGVQYVLNGAEIRNNRIRGAANYGLLSVGGAQNCRMLGNNLATFAPTVAQVGLYGVGTHDNTMRGYSGVVIEADGAYSNRVTGYTPMSPLGVPQ
jgi:hypothetical protein